MFQYTREFIINEDVKYSTKDGIVAIDGIASYRVGADSEGVPHIMSFTEVAYEAAAVPVGEITFGTAKTTVDRKLVIRVNLYRQTEASYANHLEAKMSKLFQIEIPAGYVIADAVKLINATIKHSDHPFISASVSGTKIILTGTSGYQQIKEVSLYDAVATGNHEAQWNLVQSGSVTTEGTAGFGTYEKLIKDNRMPVPENTGIFSPNKYEMPWPGGTYKLIEFKYNSGRRNIGGSGVVGSYEKSVTTHRFWVNTKSTLTEFDKAIAAIKPVATNALKD